MCQNFKWKGNLRLAERAERTLRSAKISLLLSVGKLFTVFFKILKDELCKPFIVYCVIINRIGK